MNSRFAIALRGVTPAPVTALLGPRPTRAQIEIQENQWREHFADAVSEGATHQEAVLYANAKQNRHAFGG